jgi:hypothetical protein
MKLPQFWKKRQDKKVTENIFEYFKFEKNADGTADLFGEFANKDFKDWLSFIHDHIQVILKSKLIDGKAVENYVNFTIYVCGQKVDVAIIKDGCKGPHELLQEAKKGV